MGAADPHAQAPASRQSPEHSFIPRLPVYTCPGAACAEPTNLTLLNGYGNKPPEQAEFPIISSLVTR
jgi:hypothetical protein